MQPRSPRRFRRKTRVFCASRAIFTKYMIHRFIKHGKRFDEKIHKKICVKITDLRDAGNYAINPAILQAGNCTIDRFALFRRGYRHFSFIARMDRFGKRSATCRSFRCGNTKKGCRYRTANPKETYVARQKRAGGFLLPPFSRAMHACIQVKKQLKPCQQSSHGSTNHFGFS